jgi:hypothetical protein
MPPRRFDDPVFIHDENFNPIIRDIEARPFS